MENTIWNTLYYDSQLLSDPTYTINYLLNSGMTR